MTDWVNSFLRQALGVTALAHGKKAVGPGYNPLYNHSMLMEYLFMRNLNLESYVVGQEEVLCVPTTTSKGQDLSPHRTELFPSQSFLLTGEFLPCSLIFPQCMAYLQILYWRLSKGSLRAEIRTWVSWRQLTLSRSGEDSAAFLGALGV